MTTQYEKTKESLEAVMETQKHLEEEVAVVRKELKSFYEKTLKEVDLKFRKLAGVDHTVTMLK